MFTASIDKRQVAGAMGGSGNGEEEAGGAIGSVIGGTGDIASEGKNLLLLNLACKSLYHL